MMAEFESMQDKQRVTREGPWNFDKGLILVKDFEGTKQVKNICMAKASFWIKVHDLPWMARNEFIGHELGNTLGKLEKIDVEYGEVVWGEFMNLKVCIDITKPLLWQKKLNMGGSESAWLRFTYKRLPNLCFWCGVLDHSQKECELWPQTSDKREGGNLPYGSQSKASSVSGINGAKRRPATPNHLYPHLEHHEHIISPIKTNHATYNPVLDTYHTKETTSKVAVPYSETGMGPVQYHKKGKK